MPEPAVSVPVVPDPAVSVPAEPVSAAAAVWAWVAASVWDAASVTSSSSFGSKSTSAVESLFPEGPAERVLPELTALPSAVFSAVLPAAAVSVPVVAPLAAVLPAAVFAVFWPAAAVPVPAAVVVFCVFEFWVFWEAARVFSAAAVVWLGFRPARVSRRLASLLSSAEEDSLLSEVLLSSGRPGADSLSAGALSRRLSTSSGGGPSMILSPFSQGCSSGSWAAYLRKRSGSQPVALQTLSSLGSSSVMEKMGKG